VRWLPPALMARFPARTGRWLRMSQLRERTRTVDGPLPDEAVLTGAREHPRGSGARRTADARRDRGARGRCSAPAAVRRRLQLRVDHRPALPAQLRGGNGDRGGAPGLGGARAAAAAPACLGGIGLAATSFVFLFISEHQPLFGFQEHGYRLGIVVALVAEAAAVVALAAYLGARGRGRA
jgi:hypothetical protein